MTLAANEVHVSMVVPEGITDSSLLEEYLGVLDADEKVRQARFVFAKHRHQYLVSHALVRATLSAYSELAAGDWVFEKNDYGRPDIVFPGDSRPLKFNLSHTEGLAVCAVSAGLDIGVDVENLGRTGKTVELAERYFSEPEVEALARLEECDKRDRFFDLWTLKESYMKARGIGLSLGLGNFSFELEETIEIAFNTKIVDEPKDWTFAVFDRGRTHRISLSVRTGYERDCVFKFYQRLPLREVSDCSEALLKRYKVRGVGP